MGFKELIHAIQLEFAYQWDRKNCNAEFRARNNTRAKWFVMMLRANCKICREPLAE